MSELLRQYVDSGLVKQKGTWYSVKGKAIGQKTVAEATLKKMIESGEIKEPGNDIPENVSNEVLPPSMQMPEVDGETAPEEKLPVIKPEPLKMVNPAIAKKEELSEDLEELFKPLSADLGDIEFRKKGGRFKVYVFGVDSRLKDNPLVMKCPYVFRHNDKKRNVRSGSTIFNEGWTVLSKKNIAIDKRTGKPWLTVARDDTPDEDMFTVKDYVLCYADKKQFTRKKSKQNMEDIIRASQVADKRQEQAEKAAAMSKTNPTQSMATYMASNKAAQSIAKEELEQNKKFSSQEAQEFIDNMNAVGSTSQDVEAQVNQLRHMVDSGKVGKSIKGTKPLTIEEL